MNCEPNKTKESIPKYREVRTKEYKREQEAKPCTYSKVQGSKD
jgi:hypothetical protein